MRRAARNASMPSVRRSSLKSPSRGDKACGLDAGGLGAFGQDRQRVFACGVGVTGDVEPAQRQREQDGGKVIGRECGGHWQSRQRASQRQHGLDAFAGRERVPRLRGGRLGNIEADRVAEKVAHRASRRVDRRLAETDGIEAVGIEPGAVRAGDAAAEIGDAGDHRGPGFGRRAVVRAIVATRMKSQRAGMMQRLDAAIAQIGLDERPADRLRHGEQPLRRFRRSGRGWCTGRLWLRLRVRARQAQKAPGFVGDIAEMDEAVALADHIEEIAMFAVRRVGLMFNCT
jgi:hypothetical protein